MWDNTILKPLPGHTSQDTAYVVDDYPYGFRLRCKIRYWLEYKASQGFRLWSQTTNPKKPGEVWNKPRPSTYCMLGVMGLDKENHVTWTGCSVYDFDDLEEFQKVYGESFDKNQADVCRLGIIARARYKARNPQYIIKEITPL
jgi:hypothetical protein